MEEVIYLCDRRACKVCAYPNCKHTTDIRHAKNFKVSDNGSYWEEDDTFSWEVDDDDRQEVSR